MAEAALRAALGGEAARVTVESAGTGAWEGQGPSPLAVDVAAHEGVDLRRHRSRRLTAPMVREADWVIVMEHSHLAGVRALGADESRTFVLSELAGDPDLTLDDPFGGSREAYEECWRRIRTHVEKLVPQVREALRARSA